MGIVRYIRASDGYFEDLDGYEHLNEPPKVTLTLTVTHHTICSKLGDNSHHNRDSNRSRNP